MCKQLSCFGRFDTDDDRQLHRQIFRAKGRLIGRRYVLGLSRLFDLVFVLEGRYIVTASFNLDEKAAHRMSGVRQKDNISRQLIRSM